MGTTDLMGLIIHGEERVSFKAAFFCPGGVEITDALNHLPDTSREQSGALQDFSVRETALGGFNGMHVSFMGSPFFSASLLFLLPE